jgi:hypothetical protein
VELSKKPWRVDELLKAKIPMCLGINIYGAQQHRRRDEGFYV